MRKEGARLVLEPVPPRSLLAVLRDLPTLDEEFPRFHLWWMFPQLPSTFDAVSTGHKHRL